MILIDGKKLQKEILAEIKKEVASLSFTPVFCDVLVGEDPASAQYVRMKAKMAESVGINFHNANFPISITTEELVKEIKLLNGFHNMSGIIVQLPIPAHLDQRAILDAIDPHLDVDCLGTVASNEFYNGESSFGPPTALACMYLLDFINVDLKDKKIVIIGKGELVGRPVASLFNFRELKVNIVDRRTKEDEKIKIFKEADIIISATGKGKLIKGDMIKKGVILIDAGTSESNGGLPSGQGRASIIGDVDLGSIKDVASYVSPVPGGVGPVTVAMLLKNVLKVAKKLK